MKQLVVVLLLAAAAFAVWTALPGPEGDAGRERTTSTVDRVVDGDTLVLEDGQRVRVLGIDAPEVGRDGRASECGAEQATAAARGWVEGRRVRLVGDPSQADTDRYDRLLRYVQTADDEDLGAELLRDGHARVYAPAGDVDRQSTYEEREQEARRAGRGLWSC